MKMILLMYLEDDDAVVERMLTELGVSAYSQLSLMGHGSGAPGWFGAIPAYRSRMVLTVVTPDQADRILDGVRRCTACADPAHPVHAIQMNVEEAASSVKTHKLGSTGA